MSSANKIGYGPLKGPSSEGFGSRLALAYTDNGSQIVVENGTTDTIMQLTLVTTTVSHGIGGFNLQGVASADMNLRIDVLRQGAVAASFVDQLQAGSNLVAGPFVLLGIPVQTAVWTLRLYADGGTFTMPARLSSWWIEAGGIDNGLVADDPSRTVEEQAGYFSASDDYAVFFPGLVSRSVAETADALSPVSQESLGITFGFDPGTSSADGWVSTTPAFDNTSNLLQAGNSSGEIREAFMLFDLPMDIGGRTILEAKLTLTADANMGQEVDLLIAAEDAGAAQPITSRGDYDSRAVTSATVPWSTTFVAGQLYVLPDITAVVQELASTYPSVTKLQVLIKDGPAQLNQWLTFRSAEHPQGPAPSLLLRWA